MNALGRWAAESMAIGMIVRHVQALPSAWLAKYTIDSNPD